MTLLAIGLIVVLLLVAVYEGIVIWGLMHPAKPVEEALWIGETVQMADKQEPQPKREIPKKKYQRTLE